MKAQKLGELEELILLCVCGLGEEAHAVRIQERLEVDAGRFVMLGAVYTALDRMQGKRCVRSRLSEPTAVRGGRRKRLYKVTKRGRVALEELRLARRRLWDRIEACPSGAGA